MTSNSSRDLLANSDAALYRAKQEGRNRVVRAPSQKTKGVRMEQSGAANSLAAE